MRLLTLFGALLSATLVEPAIAQESATWLIANARLADGTGSPIRSGSVRVRGNRIVDVGSVTPAPGERVVDVRGLVLAPGFIDTHSHHDRGLLEMPDALAAVSQGITTIVVGQDGGSRYPLRDFFRQLEQSPVAVNVASYAGHNTLRRRLLGQAYQRVATGAEIAEMRNLLVSELEAGALGLSTGLEYDPGIYSETEEVIALARAAAAVGGRYISHIRSEDRQLWQAVEEVIRIGREAAIPVQISHLKLAMKSLWGEAPRLLERLDRARAAGVNLSADVYPYLYWQSTMTVLFPERDFGNREVAEFALRELAPPEGLLVAEFAPDTTYVGKTVAQIATLRGTDPVTTYMALIAEALDLERRTGRSGESIIATSMDPGDVARLLAWPHANFCTDGELAGRHPRGFGAFPRILGRYVREQGVVPLPEAVRKASALAAEHMGIANRGVVRPGAYADLVLFDPAAVVDRATPEAPGSPAVGIVTVWVNGIEVWSNGATTGARPGTVLRRGDKE